MKYKPKDLAFARKAHGKLTAQQVATKLGRTASAIYQLWGRMGLMKPNRDPAALLEFIREKHPLGWSDNEIAVAWSATGDTVSRGWIGDLRVRIALPMNRFSEHCRARVAEKTKQQLEAAGLKSLADARVKAFQQFAMRHGWPADLRPRAVQILDLLYQRGPHTRREIVQATGMSWLGSRWSLKSSDPEGSYLAHLVARGLVVRAVKAVRGKGKGGSCDLYSIAPNIKRGAVSCLKD
jgi:hypothetical protein